LVKNSLSGSFFALIGLLILNDKGIKCH